MAVRNIAWILATVAAITLPLPARTQTTGRPAAECKLRWSERRPLQVDGITAFLDRPATLSLNGRALLLGAHVFAADSVGHVVHPLIPPGAHYLDGIDQEAMGVMSDGRGTWDWVSLPPRTYRFPWLPRAALDSSGTVHVVWASDDSTVNEVPSTAPTIWYARFDGRRWTPPVRIASGHRYVWDSFTVTQLVMRNRSLSFAVSTMGEGITFFRAVDGQWTSHPVPLPTGFFGYPGIVVLPKGRIVLVVQGGSARVKNGIGGSAVFITRSDDDGVTWSAPLLVSKADGEPAFDHQLLIDSNRRLRVLWFRHEDSLGIPGTQISLTNSSGRVHIAESTDDGITWQELAPSAYLPNADGLQAMQLESGTVLVTLADRVAERILLTSWNGSWQPFASIEAAPNPFHPILGRGDAQRPVLTWGTRRPHNWVITMITTLTGCR